MQAEEAAFRPCAYAEGALTHHGQTLVPGGDRLYLRLEGGGRCTVEPADYSTVRSIAATLELPGSGRVRPGAAPPAQEGEENPQEET
ncbi:MAG: hypothetical protein DUD39_09795 [Coriobacteriaceae bacterium]|nr:MAG: hypothetical protein DUD39_09795 [Coriobacteriaceae bacterium]